MQKETIGSFFSLFFFRVLSFFTFLLALKYVNSKQVIHTYVVCKLREQATARISDLVRLNHNYLMFVQREELVCKLLQNREFHVYSFALERKKKGVRH